MEQLKGSHKERSTYKFEAETHPFRIVLGFFYAFLVTSDNLHGHYFAWSKLILWILLYQSPPGKWKQTSYIFWKGCSVTQWKLNAESHISKVSAVISSADNKAVFLWKKLISMFNIFRIGKKGHLFYCYCLLLLFGFLKFTSRRGWNWNWEEKKNNQQTQNQTMIAIIFQQIFTHQTSFNEIKINHTRRIFPVDIFNFNLCPEIHKYFYLFSTNCTNAVINVQFQWNLTYPKLKQKTYVICEVNSVVWCTTSFVSSSSCFCREIIFLRPAGISRKVSMQSVCYFWRRR